MSKILLVSALSFILAIATGKPVIAALKKLKVGQPILSYVSEHKEKSGTPTMGGTIFVIPSVAAYFMVYGFEKRFSVFAVALFAAFFAIGAADDLIKIRFNKNEGLKPYQKTVFLAAVSIVGAVYISRQSQTTAYIPFTHQRLDLGWLFAVFSVFVFLSATNCVNLTDGLDGLAGSVSAVVFIAVAVLITLEMGALGDNYANEGELKSLAALSVSVAAALAGFLIYNVNKASVFMGDAGSLSLGGLIAFVFLISGNALYLPIIGWAFVFSGASVILQVAHYKRTKKRIFLMAPAHHHFQHKGYGEAKITFVYVSLTALAGTVCALTYAGV